MILKFVSASDLKFQVARFGISIIDFEFKILIMPAFLNFII